MLPTLPPKSRTESAPAAASSFRILRTRGSLARMAVAACRTPGVGKIGEIDLGIIQLAKQGARWREMFSAGQQTNPSRGCEDTLHRSFEQDSLLEGIVAASEKFRDCVIGRPGGG